MLNVTKIAALCCMSPQAVNEALVTLGYQEHTGRSSPKYAPTEKARKGIDYRFHTGTDKRTGAPYEMLTWGPDVVAELEDKFRPPTRAYIDALFARVEELEAKMARVDAYLNYVRADSLRDEGGIPKEIETRYEEVFLGLQALAAINNAG